MYAGAPLAAAPYADSGQGKVTWQIQPSQAVARGVKINWLTYWDAVPARATVHSYPISFHDVWIMNASRATARAFTVDLIAQGTATFNIIQAVSTASANPVRWFSFFDLAGAGLTAQAYPVRWKQFLAAVHAIARANAWPVDWTGVGSVDFDATHANALLRSWPVDFDYIPIIAIPDLVVRRVNAGEGAEISVLNPFNVNLSVVRADDYLDGFANLHVVPPGGLPWTDGTLDPQRTYMYRASYTLTGEKGGQPVVIAGEPSALRMTIGKNKSL